ncbi:MAG TPA: succinylglutamate desuccinylase/aspartoacylase family protein [bacterium]|nr:succinylglutamate desuccinylase/aspartoacylase family protein [bacterium]
MIIDEVGRRGTKVYGELTFDHAALAGLSWPYISIRGTADGPTVCVSAGMHGSEYAGITAAQRVAEELRPQALRGHAFILPLVNQPAFWARAAAIVPLDGKNPSQVFPGRRDGTVTEVMAAYLFDEVFCRCDALVDLHGGDIMERLVPFTIFQETGNQDLDARSQALAASYGLPIAVRRSKEVLKRQVPGYLQTAIAVRGIPSIVAEAGGEDQVKPDDVAAHISGLRGVLAHLGMIAGEAPRPALRLVEFVLVTAGQDGLFHRTADIGDRVQAGQVIGGLTDLWGRPLEDLRAPADAEVLFLSTSMAAKKGALLFGLGKPVSGT